MRNNILLKLGFILILLVPNLQKIAAQSVGSINMNVIANYLQGTEGMVGYYFPYQIGNPNLSYWVHKISIKDVAGNPLAESSNKNWYYPNSPSDTRHAPNFSLINHTLQSDDFGVVFDLSKGSSLRNTFTQIGAINTQSGFISISSDGFYKHPFTWNFNYLASTGNLYKERIVSIEGETTNGIVIKYPYYFTFASRYIVDAIEADLVISNEAGMTRNTFCERQRIKITAPYKLNFKNGTFEFQKTYDNGNSWITIHSNSGQNFAYDYATQSGVKYRARLKASSSTYGVSDFSNSSLIATSNVNIEVFPQITNFTISKFDACDTSSKGKIKITSITGAVAGNNYVVTLTDRSTGNVVGTTTIINYTSDYFSNNEVSIEADIGHYAVGIVNATGNLLPCAYIKPNVFIRESVSPVYTSRVEQLICAGENGKIHFDYVNADGKLKRARAISVSTGDTIVGNLFFQTTLNAPADKYLLSVENSDGCVYALPDTVEIFPLTPLDIVITSANIIEVEGEEYFGCHDDLVSFELSINGGVAPYSVTHQVGSRYKTSNLLANQASLNLSSFSSGIHQITVTDNLGCVLGPIEYDFPTIPEIIFPTLNIQQPTIDCNVVGSDGSITQLGNPSGGIPPYSLHFSQTEVTSFDSMNLTNSNVLLFITDSVGCVARKYAQVANPNLLRLDDDGELQDRTIPCGGTLELVMTAEGGTVASGYTFFHNGIECSLDPDCNLSYFIPASGSFAAQGGFTIQIDTAGVHYFEVMDDMGCIVSSSEEFSEPIIPEVASMSIVPPNCTNGIYETTFVLNGLNGEFISHVNYELDGVANTVSLNTVNNIMWGTPIEPYEFTIPVSGDSLHQITVSDFLSCGNSSPFEFTFEPLPPFTLNISSVQNSFCSYDTSGAIDFAMTGNSPYQVELFKDGSRIDSITVPHDSYTFSNLLTGNYQIDVADSKGCTASENNIILTIPDTIKATVASTNLIDCTGENGIIEVSNLIGGTPPFSFSLNGQPFQSNPILQNAQLENEILIRDVNNCELNLSLSIPLAGPTLFPTTTQLQAVAECQLGNAIMELQPGFTFPISITEIESPTNFLSEDILPVSDSVATVTYQDTLENLDIGMHYFLIKDGLGCEKIDSVEMNAAVPLFAEVTNKTVESCYLQSGDGSIMITIQGGAAPYTVTKLDSIPNSMTTNSTATFSGLSHGYYAFEIQDSRGCFYSLQDSIISGSLPLLNYTTSNLVGCVGENLTADITLTGYKGVAPYSFLWEDSSTDNPKLGVLPGQYMVTVTDATGCTHEDMVFFIPGDSLELNLINSIDVVCQADSTGQISVAAIGAFPPFEYSIDNGINFQSDSTFTDLPIGNYTILVKDNHNCTDTTSATISFNNPLIATVITTNENCTAADDGTITITVNGGVSPFTYSLDNINFQSQNIFAGLTAGNYSAWIQDGSGCKAVYHNNIITEPTILTLSTSLIANETCNQMNGSASGIAMGGTPPYIYEWDNNPSLSNSILENAAAGLHSLKVTDANLCTINSLVTIGFEAAPELFLEDSQSEICGNANGLIDLKITNGVAPFTFQWSHNGSLNDSLATNLVAGNYSVTVSDANACTDILNIMIDEIVAPELILENSQSEICGNSNGLIDLKITNGVAPFTFQWSHNGSLNDSLATGLTSGNYSVTVSDANGCTGILAISINEIAGPTLAVFSKTNSLCIDNNGEIVLENTNGTAPFTYTWSHDATLNNNTATNLPSGNYSVTVSDSNGCSDIISTDIDFDNPPILISSDITHAVCDEANGVIQLSVSGGAMQPYSYIWSHDLSLNSALASDLLNGIYSVTVSDAQGCSDSLINIIVNNSPAPILSIASFNNSDCLNPMGNITVQSVGGTAPLTYTWSHDSNVTGTYADGLSSGNYSITVTDANGCNSIVTQSLIEFEGDISIENSLECSYDFDGTLLVTLQGNPTDYNYAWSDSAIPNFHIASNLSSGTYTVTITNSNGCTQDFSIELSAPDEIIPNISNIIPVGCNGNLGSATANPTGGIGNYIYNWSDPNGQTTPTANNLPVGNYTVLVIDENGCTAFENVEIMQAPQIILAQGNIANPLCNGSENGSTEVIASQGFPPFNYLWSDGQTTPIASNLGAGDFTVTVTDAVGCTQILTTSINEPTELSANAILIQEPLCFGGNEGEVSVLISGGTAPYQYQWDDDLSQTSDTATNLIAGIYNVFIADANGCTIVADVEITQPAVLEITNSILQIPTCVGDADGNIEVVVGGGTPDYQYIWNGGGATNNNTFTNIEDGFYTVEVVDNNGCTIAETIELEDPDSILLVMENLTPVSCEGTPNGQIEILAEGGDQNISYAWNNGIIDNFLENLNVGNYEVSITDGLGCEIIEVFEIESIDIEPLDLGGEDTLLCNNGMLFYDFSNTDYIELSWGNLSEGELSNATEFTTHGEDIYYLHALRSDGCLVEDSIQIRFTEGNLDAFFIAPTDIVVGDTIVALELTLPIPDNVGWVYDENNIEFVEQRDNQYLFYFSAVGEYSLKMTSSLGGCQNDISKTIFVYADSTEIPFINAAVPTITELNLFPNPNDGIFTINVELANINDMVIDIFNEQSMLMNRNIFTGKDIYSKNYQLDLPTGIYYVIVQVAGARRSLTFVID